MYPLSCSSRFLCPGERPNNWIEVCLCLTAALDLAHNLIEFCFITQFSPCLGICRGVGEHVGCIREGSLVRNGLADQVSTVRIKFIVEKRSRINNSLLRDPNESHYSPSSALDCVGTWTLCLTWRMPPMTELLMHGSLPKCAPATGPTSRNVNKPSPKCQK